MIPLIDYDTRRRTSIQCLCNMHFRTAVSRLPIPVPAHEYFGRDWVHCSDSTSNSCVLLKGAFFINPVSPPDVGEYRRTLKSILGIINLTRTQATAFKVKPNSQLSPYFEMCALRISANVSYTHASEDLAVLTGITVRSKTQQRSVHHQSFNPSSLTEGVAQLSWGQYSVDYSKRGTLSLAWL